MRFWFFFFARGRAFLEFVHQCFFHCWKLLAAFVIFVNQMKGRKIEK